MKSLRLSYKSILRCYFFACSTILFGLIIPEDCIAQRSEPDILVSDVPGCCIGDSCAKVGILCMNDYNLNPPEYILFNSNNDTLGSCAIQPNTPVGDTIRFKDNSGKDIQVPGGSYHSNYPEINVLTIIASPKHTSISIDGETTACTGLDYQYYVDGSLDGDSVLWYLNNVKMKSIIYPDNSFTVNFSEAGYYEISVSSKNYCDSVRCEITVTVYTSPVSFNLSTIDGLLYKTICGNETFSLKLDDSDQDVTYLLLRNDTVLVNSAITGDGNSLEWNDLVLGGTYTAKAINANSCESEMNGAVIITSSSVNAEVIYFLNPSLCDKNDGIVQVTKNPIYTYNWYKNGVSMGFNSDTVTWAEKLLAGTYTITITDSLSKCSVSLVKILENGSFEIIVNHPEYSCDGSEFNISLSASGNNYLATWKCYIDGLNKFSGSGPTNLSITLNTGSHSIAVSGTNQYNCPDSVPYLVTVLSKPVVNSIDIYDNEGALMNNALCQGVLYNLIANGDSGNYKYVWNLPPVDTLNLNNLSHKMDSSGSAQITVLKFHSILLSCSTTFSKTVLVNSAPEANTIVNLNTDGICNTNTDLLFRVKDTLNQQQYYEWMTDPLFEMHYFGEIANGTTLKNVMYFDPVNTSLPVDVSLLTMKKYGELNCPAINPYSVTLFLSGDNSSAKPEVRLKTGYRMLICKGGGFNVYNWMYLTPGGISHNAGSVDVPYFTLPDEDTIQTNSRLYYLEAEKPGNCIVRSFLSGKGAVVTDNSDFHGVNISPNPVNSVLNLTFSDATQGEIYYKIYDMFGRQSLSKSISKSGDDISIELDISSLPVGMYLLEVLSDHERLGVTRFIKQ